MGSAIQDLIGMRDIESLYEVMTENEDWMLCMDAAEGLIKLGDVRGLQFLQDATESDDEELVAVAQEILDSPEAQRMSDAAKTSEHKSREEILVIARQRLAQGKKIFRFKSVYLDAPEFSGPASSEDGESIPVLDDFGLEGWQVVAFVGPESSHLPGSTERKMIGGYFLLQKEIDADELAELKEA